MGLLALSDQGLVSGSNFILNVLLARWLDPSQYGAFAVAFSILLLLAGLHNALVLEPMAVLGPSRHTAHLRAYFGAQTRLHFAVTVPLGLLLTSFGLIALWLRPGGDLGFCMIGAGLSLPFILFLWLARRFPYILARPHGALIGTAAYPFLLLAGLLTARSLSWITPLSGFFVMAVAGLTAGVIIKAWNRNACGDEERTSRLSGVSLIREQWDYGRWQAAATALNSVGTQIQILLLGALVGLDAAGALRAMEILMLPMAQGVTAISTLGLPLLSREHGRGHVDVMRRKGLVLMGVLLTAACIYEGLLLIGARALEQALYQGRFASYVWVIPLLGLVPIFTSIASGCSLMLRAAQRPKHQLVAGAIATPVAVASVVILVPALGVVGAAASFVLAHATTAGVIYCHFRTWMPDQARAFDLSGRVESRAERAPSHHG